MYWRILGSRLAIKTSAGFEQEAAVNAFATTNPLLSEGSRGREGLMWSGLEHDYRVHVKSVQDTFMGVYHSLLSRNGLGFSRHAELVNIQT
jgi:hypothetical protein